MMPVTIWLLLLLAFIGSWYSVNPFTIEPCLQLHSLLRTHKNDDITKEELTRYSIIDVK